MKKLSKEKQLSAIRFFAKHNKIKIINVIGFANFIFSATLQHEINGNEEILLARMINK